MEQLDSPELSADDSPFTSPVSSKGSSDVSVTDSAGVERVKDYEEVASEGTEGVFPPFVPVTGSCDRIEGEMLLS